jgi:hypothetical protein
MFHPHAHLAAAAPDNVKLPRRAHILRLDIPRSLLLPLLLCCRDFYHAGSGTTSAVAGTALHGVCCCSAP